MGGSLDMDRVRRLGLGRGQIDLEAAAQGFVMMLHPEVVLGAGDTFVAALPGPGSLEIVLKDEAALPGSCVAVFAYIHPARGHVDCVVPGLRLWPNSAHVPANGIVRILAGDEPTEVRLYIESGACRFLPVWSPEPDDPNSHAYTGKVQGWLRPSLAGLASEFGEGPTKPEQDEVGGGRTLSIDLHDGVDGRDQMGPG